MMWKKSNDTLIKLISGPSLRRSSKREVRNKVEVIRKMYDLSNVKKKYLSC
jgi:hypothetical protein